MRLAERFAARRCRILYRLEVWFGCIFPAILELLGNATATLGETGIAYLVVVHQCLSTSGTKRLHHIRLRGIRYALIALAMVVGTDIKNGVVFAVVPSNQFVILLHKREESALLLAAFGTFHHLCQQPRARDNSVSLKQFDACRRTHLARNDTGEITLYGQFVDGAYLVCLNHEFQRAEEGLRLLALPVELPAYCDITDGERGALCHWFKHQFTVLRTVPEYSSLAELHLLLALEGLSLGRIFLV